MPDQLAGPVSARAIVWLTGAKDVAPTVVEAAVERVRAVLSGGDCQPAVCGRHLPGGLKSGGFSIEAGATTMAALWGRLEAADVVQALGDKAFRRHNVVTFDGSVTRMRGAAEPAPGLIKRTLLVRVDAGAPAERIRAYEATMAAMPDYVDVIRNWNFARLATGGAAGFTHVWEQEFAQLTHFTEDYFSHPYHWGVVNAWHDPQFPYAVVDPTAVAQGWYHHETSVLGHFAGPGTPNATSR